MIYEQSDLRYSFFEISEILRYMPIEYNSKLPEKLKNLINENKINNGFIYDKDKTLDNQDILRGTKVLLSVLYREYWCSKEKRTELEEKDNKILQEKYSYEKLFKEKNKTSNYKQEECKSLEIVPNKWYQKLFCFIKKLMN